MKHEIKIKNRIARYSSTILLPSSGVHDLNRILIRFGTVRNFLHQIVMSEHWLFNIKPRETDGKTLYQKKGQALKRLDFRPYEEDWERFRLLAMMQKVSMSRLFIILLLFWDYESVEVPTIPPKKILMLSLESENNYINITLKRFLL